MLSTQNNSTINKNIDTFVNNSALSDSQKIDHRGHSKDGESKSNSNVSHAYKHSRSQNISFPEADHEKKQAKSHNEEVANKKIMIENKTINERKK